jgi:hypothetical protein
MCPIRPAAVGYERSGYQTVGAQDTRYPVMSGLYTQSSLPDSNLVYGEEHGPSILGVVLLSSTSRYNSNCGLCSSAITVIAACRAPLQIFTGL